jgi:hypothetical protein
MSVREQTQAPDAPVPGAAAEDQAANVPDAAARLLGRLSVIPALIVMAWLLAGLPLLLAGQFRPVLMLVISVPLAIALLWFGLRWIPGRSHGALPARDPQRARTPWWAVAGVLAVAVAFGVDQMIYHSQFIIVNRDPASYFQFGYWISHHGSLPIPQDAAAFGGTHHVLTFGSFAYYQVGNSVVPQFMAGLPMVLSAAFWAGGVGWAVAVSPVLGACAVLTFGGLVARLAGPRWAPLAALTLAVSMPEMFTSRSDYSEPLTQILFLGGLCLVIDALNSEGTGARVIAGLAGLALGLTLLVRIDGAADVLPLVPYCGLLLLRRRPQVLPLFAGLVVGTAYGLVDGFKLSYPYLDSIRTSLDPLGALVAVVVVVTVVALAVLWRRRLPATAGKWLPNAAAALAVLVTIGFTLRPEFQVVRQKSSAFSQSVMAFYQRLNHLPVDPTRVYWELSMDWVFWYIGVPAVLLATLGAALLARRCLRGEAPATWTLPLVIFAWTIVYTLYYPGITPDQPWASRRLVPAVLPGLILLAVWGLSWVISHLRAMDLDRVLYGGLVFCLLALLVLPGTVTSFGLRVRHGGPVGVKIVADGTAEKTTYRGEVTAVADLCRAIPAHSSVVIVDSGTSNPFTEVVRAMCGEPAAGLSSTSPAKVRQVISGIVAAGRRPVLLAARPVELAPYGAPARQVMRLRTTLDASKLTSPPEGVRPFAVNIWMSLPSP